ncbi:MAG TPA: pyridoxamine 5'-phosphate oxidase family protein [Acidimicrobiales bacterium]|nr:pyridoxamine 5'-phosphate oxidase family protein [Acidimicrobiales bacterium]
MSAPVSERSRVKRLPDRAAYDAASIDAVLDAALVGHVGFVAAGRPVVIPMIYGRDGDVLYLHGSVASRLQRTLANGIDVCLTVTLVDGLVLARSAFHHSMNYRSAVVMGRAVLVRPDEKEHALRVISEHLTPGRWSEVRPPTPVELKQTSVLRLAIEEASAKARTGGPIDDDEDIDLPVWAGVIPCSLTWGDPVDATDLRGTLPPSPSVVARST